MRVPDADLHGQHLWRRIVLQEVGQVPQCGHQEACLVTVEMQLKEAVAFGQRRVSSGAGPTLQASLHLRIVTAPDRGSTAVTSCEQRPGLQLALALASVSLNVELIQLKEADIKIHPK